MTDTPAPRRHRAEPEAVEFGDQIIIDHIVIGEADESLSGQRAAVVMLDRGAGWLDCQPVADKSAGEAYRALDDFAGPTAVVWSFFSDNSPELIRAANDLAATPGRPATNGVAERAVRSVLDGTHTVLKVLGCHCDIGHLLPVIGVSSTTLRHVTGIAHGISDTKGTLQGPTE